MPLRWLSVVGFVWGRPPFFGSRIFLRSVLQRILEDLTGVALNVEPSSHRIAAFIFLPGMGWFSKPTCSNLLTRIESDGSFRLDVTTGDRRPYADQSSLCEFGRPGRPPPWHHYIEAAH